MRIKYAIINKEFAEQHGIDTSIRQAIHDGDDIIVTEDDITGIDDIPLLSREEIYREINNLNKKK